MKRIKNRILVGLMLFPLGFAMLYAAVPADFAVADILVKADKFVHIKLENRSPVSVPIPPAQREKVFLVIYINNVKRAEYKLKYIDPKLFTKRGSILFRTNFRLQQEFTVKVEINGLKILGETQFANNRLTRKISPGGP